MLGYRVILLPLSLLLLSVSGASAQRDPGLDHLALDLQVAHSPRQVYRAALVSLMRQGFQPRVLSLDEVIVTQPQRTPHPDVSLTLNVEVEEGVSDSTHLLVRGSLLRSASSSCAAEECERQLALLLVTLTQVAMEMDSITPGGAAAARADSLAAADAYGYSPRNPIQVGGAAAPQGQRTARQHAYLSALRGPAGEPVRYFRLGSCCRYHTTNAPGGTGLLDGYDVTYEGAPGPVVLYLTLYDEGPLQAPDGFTLRTPAAELAHGADVRPGA